MSTTGLRPDRRRRTNGALIYPARVTDRIRFPTDFGRRFTIFIYTQETFARTESPANPRDVIRTIPEFQRMAEAHGVIPTYLLNYPVAMSGAAHEIIGAMAENGRAVLGALLQPWATPPFDEELTSANSYAGNLALALERAKIASLSEAIASHFSVQPVIYSAGRYGVGPNTAALLSQAGYRMDVSVRPRFDYRSDGGPDFSRHDARPFWAGPDTMLIELPVGACYTGTMRRFGPLLQRLVMQRNGLGGLLARGNAFARIALTPEDMPIADAKEAVNVMLADGIQLLSFAMHAPSLLPGHTPYVKSSAELNLLYRWWEEMFAYLASRDIKPIASDAAVAAAWAARA